MICRSAFVMNAEKNSLSQKRKSLPGGGISSMRHCSRCSFKHDEMCGFWETLRSHVCIVDCSERFIRECCKEEIFECGPGSDIIIADYDEFLIKWSKYFQKDKKRARPTFELI